MSIEITEELVAHVAQLARLDLGDDERAEMRGHFEKILSFVDILNSLDTEAVDPSIFALDTYNVMAEDRKSPSLSVDSALANGPAQQDGFFLVPRIISEV